MPRCLLPTMGSSIHIILQARVNSTRLHGKALLPVGGVPSAILAALRASRGGLGVTLATSDHPSDDPLAVAAKSAGVSAFRGSERDVLGRFIAATSGLPDTAAIVRLTADNVFPDGDFVALLADALGAADIVGTTSAKGLPYGLSGEAFRLSALRRAAAATDAPFDREHVTPWLYRNARSATFSTLNGKMNLGCLRCTLDVASDYEVLTRVFDGVADPIEIGWRELVARLAALPSAPQHCVPKNKGAGSSLVLGTAQLAAPYGSIRKTRAPSPEESTALVHTAIRHGITHIDTARAYPDSEARLGAALADGWTGRVQVITKLALLAEVPAEASAAKVRAAVDASVAESRYALRLAALPVLLLHRAAHLDAWNGAAWNRLKEMHYDGIIGVLGVSVQSLEEARAALAVPEVRHIQLACNILDTRWEKGELATLIAARTDVTVHARGALLQGLLLTSDPAVWPKIQGLDVAGLSDWLTQMARRLNRRDVADLCYAWLRAQDWIDAVVVGMESEAQMADNAALFARRALDAAALAEIARSRPPVPQQLLNPSLWPA
jgi:spore coat polysaccharide biosynthesis protein SpsF (cytidylyltransferase family)/aryl-alcohol dehydrogenase-like predicted oxidoreductase